MEFFKNFDWSAKSIAKVIGVILLAIVGLAIAAGLISFAFRTITNMSQSRNYGISGGGYATTEEAMAPSYYSKDMAMGGSSIGYPTPIAPPNFSTGNNAEKYEVITYSGTIKTRKLDQTCDAISILKAKKYVIFEDSNRNEDTCYFRFKVAKENVDEIVKVIEGLKPETLNVNVQSIKSQIEGMENEMDILKKQLASVEETLQSAQSAYDEISKLATKQQDADTLAKIIDSKLNLIERLTNQKLSIKSQIDSYDQSKADQLDQLNYTFFDVNVYKDLIFDWKNIKDSWKYETKLMVTNINAVFQSITLNLVTYLVRFAQVVLYFFISVLLLKFVWMGVKRIWKGEWSRKARR